MASAQVFLSAIRAVSYPLTFTVLLIEEFRSSSRLRNFCQPQFRCLASSGAQLHLFLSSNRLQCTRCGRQGSIESAIRMIIADRFCLARSQICGNVEFSLRMEDELSSMLYLIDMKHCFADADGCDWPLMCLLPAVLDHQTSGLAQRYWPQVECCNQSDGNLLSLGPAATSTTQTSHSKCQEARQCGFGIQLPTVCEYKKLRPLCL